MRRMKQLLFTVLATISVLSLSAQRRPTAFLELGGFGMTQNYMGDVNNRSLSAFSQEARPGVGLQLKYNFSSLFSVGGEVNFSNLYSHDNLHGNANRDYIVSTELLQMGAFTNFHFIPFGKYNRRNGHTPFLHAGINAVTFQPDLNTSAQYPDEIDLHPGTGATFSYTLGCGWRIRRSLKSFVNVGIFYSGFGTSHIEGFDFTDEHLAADPSAKNTMDGCLTLRLGMSLGFFEQ